MLFSRRCVEDRLGGATRAQDLARMAALPPRSLEYNHQEFFLVTFSVYARLIVFDQAV
jgi:hypothetical protein